MNAYIHIDAYMLTNKQTNKQTNSYMHIHAHTCTYIRMHKRIHIHTCTYTYTYTHTHMHIHIGGKPEYLFPWGPEDDPSRYPKPNYVYFPNGTQARCWGDGVGGGKSVDHLTLNESICEPIDR